MNGEAVKMTSKELGLAEMMWRGLKRRDDQEEMYPRIMQFRMVPYLLENDDIAREMTFG